VKPIVTDILRSNRKTKVKLILRCVLGKADVATGKETLVERKASSMDQEVLQTQMRMIQIG